MLTFKSRGGDLPSLLFSLFSWGQVPLPHIFIPTDALGWKSCTNPPPFPVYVQRHIFCILGLLSLPNSNPSARSGHSEGPADHFPLPIFIAFQSALWSSVKLTGCLGPLSWAQGVSQDSEAGFWPERKPHPFSWTLCACAHPQFEPCCQKIPWIEVMVAPDLQRSPEAFGVLLEWARMNV